MARTDQVMNRRNPDGLSYPRVMPLDTLDQPPTGMTNSQFHGRKWTDEHVDLMHSGSRCLSFWAVTRWAELDISSSSVLNVFRNVIVRFFDGSSKTLA